MRAAGIGCLGNFFAIVAGKTEASTYAAVNLMWSPLPYLTLGIEYGYGELENRDGSGLDNHRIGFGMQVY